MIDLKNKRVVLTGGYGFLGEELYQQLQAAGADPIRFHRQECDLVHDSACFHNMLWNWKPDFVVHAAADVGGIAYNRKNSAALMVNNLKMGINVLEACKANQIQRLIMIGSVCAYPSPFPDDHLDASENDLWQGRPEESNAGYGISKRTLMELAEQFHNAGWQKCVNLVMTNLYGPRDTFDYERCHVVPALIRRFYEAEQNGDESVTCWGDGTPTRDLLYVVDAVRAIVCALQADDPPASPINISSNFPHSIQYVAERIAGLTAYRGRIEWDKSKPNGQLVRQFTNLEARLKLDWRPKTLLITGLRKTVDWYAENPFTAK